MAAVSKLGMNLARLQQGNPIAFDAALSELRTAYTDALRALAHAPAAEIMVVQGQARAMEWILREFEECTLTRPVSRPA